jgi:uncharacterized membrane protein
MDDAGPSHGVVHWEADLRPHRSLPPKGFRILMLCLGIVSFISGVIFISIGAWPVCGFFGLDVLLVYLAFRMNYRSGRMREVLQLVDDDFTVRRISIRNEIRFWRFQAYWLRVELVETGETSNRLLLTSHGNTLAVAGFLNPDERVQLAKDVRSALARWKYAVG